MPETPKTFSMLKIWRYIALFMATVIVHSLIQFLFAPETKSLLLALSSTIAFLPLLWLSLGKSIETLRQSLKNWHWLIFLLLLSIAIILGSQKLTDLLYIHANLIYWPFAVLFYQQIYTESHLSYKWLLLASLALFILISIVRLLGLSYFPNYQLIDEPWVFSMLINHVQEGEFGDPITYGRTVDVGYAILPWAYWMRLGEPSLWFGRLYHFLLYLPFCGFLGLAAYHLFDKYVGILSFFAAFASATLYGSLHIRHDLELLSFIAPALAAYAYGLKRKAWIWHGLAGALIGLGLFAHYHAIGLGPMLAIALYLPLYLSGKREGYLASKGDFFAFIFGGLVGATIVFCVNILPQLSAVLEGREWRGILDPFQFPIMYIFYLYVARQNIFEQLLTLIALALLFYKANSKDKMLIWLYFIGPLMLSLLATGVHGHYSQHIAFVFPLMIARAVQKACQLIRIQSLATQIALGLLLIAPMLGSTSPLFVLLEQKPLDIPEPPTVTWIRENIPTGSVIVGPNWYYFFLYEDYRYYSNRSWAYASKSRQARYADDSSRFWDEINPDVIIVWDIPMQAFASEALFIDDAYLNSRNYQLISISEIVPRQTAVENIEVFVRP